MNIKTKILLSIVVFMMTAVNVMSQEKRSYSTDDVKQFYRTIEGSYKASINDSTSLTLHFTPIWQSDDNPFQWLYMDLYNSITGKVIEQKVIEVKPKSDKLFNVYVYNLDNPTMFVGKWKNRSYFDGFNQDILGKKSRLLFTKTKDFEYQTSWQGIKNIKAFITGDRVHYKFVQGDERFYVKRVPKKKGGIANIEFVGMPID